MPRPRKKRIISEPPKILKFKPVGIPSKTLGKIIINLEEYEALRLADYENLEHSEAAKLMQISRPTFTRLIDAARKKLSNALVNGHEILIEGGDFEIRHHLFECNNCNSFFRNCEKTQSEHCPFCDSEDIKDLNKAFHPKAESKCRSNFCSQKKQFKNQNKHKGGRGCRHKIEEDL